MIRPILAGDDDLFRKHLGSDTDACDTLNTNVWDFEFPKFGKYGPGYVSITEDGEVQGFIYGDCYGEGYAEIQALYVVKEYRGKGVAKELLNTIEAYFLGLGAKAIELTCFTDELKEFYTKQGYKTLASYTKHYRQGKYKDRNLMYKDF